MLSVSKIQGSPMNSRGCDFYPLIFLERMLYFDGSLLTLMNHYTPKSIPNCRSVSSFLKDVSTWDIPQTIQLLFIAIGTVGMLGMFLMIELLLRARQDDKPGFRVWALELYNLSPNPFPSTVA